MYKNPTPTVDVVIEYQKKIVLIKRKNEPLGWALPGGFVDEGELVEEAAIREALEETSLTVKLSDLLYVYSHPSRDPRKHTMSTVFIGQGSGRLKAQDDALECESFALDDLPTPIVFDHQDIINDYARFRQNGKRPTPEEMRQRFST